MRIIYYILKTYNLHIFHFIAKSNNIRICDDANNETNICKEQNMQNSICVPTSNNDETVISNPEHNYQKNIPEPASCSECKLFDKFKITF